VRIWAFIMLVIAICGLVLDLFYSSPLLETSKRIIMQDLLLLLFALGVLIRIRSKIREGEKEKLAAAGRMKNRAEKRGAQDPWNKN
jgi:hypothetical protein